MNNPPTDLIEESLVATFGPRCETKDTQDFPEVAGQHTGRCPACLAWEQFDALVAASQTAFDKCAQIAQGNGAYATARTIRAYRRKDVDHG